MSKRSREDDDDDDDFVEEISEKRIKSWKFDPSISAQEEIDNYPDDIKEGTILSTNTGNQATEIRYKVMKNEEGLLYPKEIVKPAGSDYYGGKRKRSRKTKKSRKSKKSRKTKRSKKSKKTRKSRK